MMRLLLDVCVAASVLLPSAAYLYFRGERLLDRVIEIQKRYCAGYYRAIDPNAKCPSCGACDGEIFYNAEIQRVVHTCHVDNAMWPEMPRIPAKAWDFLGRDLKLAGERAEDVREAFARANAPIVLKEKKSEAVQ